MKKFKILSSPRVVFCFFSIMNFVLLNRGIKQNAKFLSSQLDVRASPRQLSQFTANSNVYGDPSELNFYLHDNECSFELGNEYMHDGTSGHVENVKSEKEDEVGGIEDLGKVQDGQEEKSKQGEQCDEEDLMDHEGRIDIASISKKHAFVMPKDEVELLLVECIEIQISDYQIAMDNLLRELHELASKYGMSEEKKMKLWNECQEKISNDFKEVDDYYYEIYSFNMHADTVATAPFLSSLKTFLNLWKNCIHKTERKWSSFFKVRAQE
ncbi:Plasmodium exported protein, unknown function [Plasmodium knowlesi strain H]|uniref:Plasmodium RESA N-terminal domain-containing protein n=3 Tax=Plasmodium knowlesi TaxID=5850 RepID=A0A5K1V2A9_PLAKH|nr:Plasmodium exported protein (PHIST), unknown function [Plasmodium knowlesi strain H]OTN64973.1 Uncharacterized protein PKNOH_S120164700 [Plasmodium knowlesi]CAA9988503.1 Plasmodium exported protein (PHIST), unknown function [Plasmodium knowlesi strain H]SBO19686.1 Plasmodium exported protein, unknown function [Plasmodium knowlesi strain H]SBO20511.1 Plasmodium exported protein, unknown function [Plasmodium knowlesi strain H]VVS77977.1 Plasmodium exported protein (PHIST), unknown function [P|eukprot:XP_002259480.1 hypothetical protein, conserved in Plasmodium species [Plasmodium knowlesi strain H]